jgi:cytochrome P450
VRRRVSRPFTVGAVQKMRPSIERVVRPIVSRFVERGSGDFVEGIANPVAGMNIAELLAIDPDR